MRASGCSEDAEVLQAPNPVSRQSTVREWQCEVTRVRVMCDFLPICRTRISFRSSVLLAKSHEGHYQWSFEALGPAPAQL